MIDKMICDRIARLRAVRHERQSLADQAAALLGITSSEVVVLAQKRIEIKDMMNQLQQDNNQYIKALLQIYDALGYTDDVPQLQQGEILWAIDAVHKAALAKGYKWDGRQYSNGNKIVTLDYVASRVTAELAEVTA